MSWSFIPRQLTVSSQLPPDQPEPELFQDEDSSPDSERFYPKKPRFLSLPRPFLAVPVHKLHILHILFKGVNTSPHHISTVTVKHCEPKARERPHPYCNRSNLDRQAFKFVKITTGWEKNILLAFPNWGCQASQLFWRLKQEIVPKLLCRLLS